MSASNDATKVTSFSTVYFFQLFASFTLRFRILLRLLKSGPRACIVLEAKIEFAQEQISLAFMGNAARNSLLYGGLGVGEILRGAHDLGTAIVDVAVGGERGGLVVSIQRLVVLAGNHEGIAQQSVVVGCRFDRAFA